ncbi:hypothetical protein C8R43DRAFT_1025041 [Mycena crocata]|nr:hypothetical protein C8R43DRAFT_1025041 [Mycena crocata]
MFDIKRSLQSRRIWAASLAAMLSLIVLLSTGFASFESSLWPAGILSVSSPNEWATETTTVTVHAPNPTPLLLKETATASFKENLRPELKYITAWPRFGWSNQVMESMNLIYLGMITERVPILAPFRRMQNESKLHVDFGDIFDVPRLQKEMGKRVLEWRQVKDPGSETLDELGCWNLERSVWRSIYSSHRPNNFNLDISYTLAPDWVKLRPTDFSDMQATFWGLAALGYDDSRPANTTPELSPIRQAALAPDNHLLCFDNLYFVCAFQAWEFKFEYYPAWRFVGRHMHWTAKMQTIADGYTRKALGVGPDELIPPYIAIHVRHGDFKNQCGDVPIEECFAPLAAYARRVEEVSAEIHERRGIRVHRVIMTSDERDLAWWDAVREMGWDGPDHTQTAARYGAFYAVFIDAAIQSGALGFVGTRNSTVSLLARRRVSAWQGGVFRTVHWGYKGADDMLA